MEGPDACSCIATSGPARAATTRRDWRRHIAQWRARAASRRLLAQFDQRMLRDIGIDPAERWHEARKRFWQA